MIVENFFQPANVSHVREKKKKKFFLSKARSRFKKFNTGHESTHAIDPLAKRATRAIKIKKNKKKKEKEKIRSNITVALTKSRCNISRGLLR